MFRSSENLRLAADMRALARVAAPWRAARTSWFDGTPESIEARLAATERVLSYAQGGLTPAHLELAREASAARAELREASHRLMVDFLDDGARAFRGSKRVASELNWDDEDPELARLREETGWDEDGDSDVHPNAREDVPDPGLLSNFDKFVQSGEIPSADAMREDIARWTGKEGSRRVAADYTTHPGVPLNQDEGGVHVGSARTASELPPWHPDHPDNHGEYDDDPYFYDEGFAADADSLADWNRKHDELHGFDENDVTRYSSRRTADESTGFGSTVDFDIDPSDWEDLHELQQQHEFENRLDPGSHRDGDFDECPTCHETTDPETLELARRYKQSR